VSDRVRDFSPQASSPMGGMTNEIWHKVSLGVEDDAPM